MNLGKGIMSRKIIVYFIAERCLLTLSVCGILYKKRNKKIHEFILNFKIQSKKILKFLDHNSFTLIYHKNSPVCKKSDDVGTIFNLSPINFHFQ